MKHRWIWRSLTLAAGLAAGQALSYPAVLIADVNLRAGPDKQFPVVHVLRERTDVEVRGCESDYRWCDVQTGQVRGWVNADYLQATYQGSDVTVAERGRDLGLPILSFVIAAYWADHYRDRLWHNRWQHWRDWNYRPRPPAWHPAHRPPGWRPPPVRPPIARPPIARPPIARPPAGGRPPGVVQPPPRPHPRPPGDGRPPRPMPPSRP